MTKGAAGPTLSASRWGKRFPMFPDRQVIRQVRPDGRGSWLKAEGPECSGTEHSGGPTTKTSNSPAQGPKNLLQEEVLEQAREAEGTSPTLRT